jgi:hypothetical protein
MPRDRFDGFRPWVTSTLISQLGVEDSADPIYRKTGNVPAVKLLIADTKLDSAVSVAARTSNAH